MSLKFSKLIELCFFDPNTKDWIMDHGKSDRELRKLNDTRDDHRNLNMGGLQYNELKLQLDTNHNVIYCDLPKCGSSVWQKQMMKVSFIFHQ